MTMPDTKANSISDAAPETLPARNRGRQAGSGSRQGGNRRVSMREVAQQASVSVATVSMVLNDNPRISKATQIKVRRIIEKLGNSSYSFLEDGVEHFKTVEWFLMEAEPGRIIPEKDFFIDYQLLTLAELDRLTFEPDREMAGRAFARYQKWKEHHQ